MTLANDIDITDRNEALAFWESRSYQEAAEKLYDAANYAQNILKNEAISKKILVEYHLADIATDSTGFEEAGIDRLLQSIKDLLDLRTDDRLPAKLAPYQRYFKIAKCYVSKRYEDLGKQIDDIHAQSDITPVDTAAVALAHIGQFESKLYAGYDMARARVELTRKIGELRQKTELPASFEQHLRHLEGKLKKKANSRVESAIEQFSAATNHIVIRDMMAKMAKVEERIKNDFEPEFYRNIKFWNIVGVLSLLFAASIAVSFTSKPLFSAITFALPLSIGLVMYFGSSTIKRLFATSKAIAVSTFALAAVVGLFAVYTQVGEGEKYVSSVKGSNVDFYYEALFKQPEIGDLFTIHEEVLTRQDGSEVGGESYAIIKLYEALGNDRYKGRINYIKIGNQGLSRINPSISISKTKLPINSEWYEFGTISQSKNKFQYIVAWADNTNISVGDTIIALGSDYTSYGEYFSSEIVGYLQVIELPLNQVVVAPLDSSKIEAINNSKYAVKK